MDVRQKIAPRVELDADGFLRISFGRSNGVDGEVDDIRIENVEDGCDRCYDSGGVVADGQARDSATI